jgi:hypothetical protein
MERWYRATLLNSTSGKCLKSNTGRDVQTMQKNSEEFHDEMPVYFDMTTSCTICDANARSVVINIRQQNDEHGYNVYRAGRWYMATTTSQNEEFARGTSQVPYMYYLPTYILGFLVICLFLVFPPISYTSTHSFLLPFVVLFLAISFSLTWSF